MFRSCILLIFLTNFAKSCKISTFRDTSGTVIGVTGGVKLINGCLSPGKQLEKVSQIYIINQTVPILYEDAVNNLNVEFIFLERDGIEEIRPGAFRNLPKLRLILLQFNNFKQIRDGVFNHLLFSELVLTNNGIEVIAPGAFDDLPNLSTIKLGYNKIKVWESVWFRGSPQIVVLNFEHNLIETLPTKAFQNINDKLKVSTRVFLNNNKIKEISDGAFDGIEILGVLFLQRNQIEEFNLNSLGSLKRIHYLQLEFNKLKCVPEELRKIAPIMTLNGNPLREDCVKKRQTITRGPYTFTTIFT